MKEHGIRKYPVRTQAGQRAGHSWDWKRKLLIVINGLLGYLCLLAMSGFLLGFIAPLAVYLPDSAGNIKLPLALPKQIAVDDNGLIYCGLGYYEKIQVYSQSGKFLRGWFVGNDKFGMTIRDGKVAVITFANRLYVYDLHGHLQATEDRGDPGKSGKFNEALAGLRGNGMGPVKDGAGNEYVIEPHWLFPQIVKTSASGKRSVLVSNPFYLAIFAGPYASWVCFAVSGLLYEYTNRRLDKGKP